MISFLKKQFTIIVFTYFDCAGSLLLHGLVAASEQGATL